MTATRVLLDDLLPPLRTVWVDATRPQAIEVALAFDDGFVDQGFRMWES